MQLALVPTLFLLPPWMVPVAMAAGIVVSRIPAAVRGRLALAPCNAWLVVGPVAAGSPGPGEAGVALLAAQIGTEP